MNILWNADGYTEDFSFVYQYGKDVLGLVPKGERGLAIDLGCGNGALTLELAKKGYRVIGIDASPEMLAVAREQHPDITFEQADACNFVLKEKADVIFSNAVFHWIDKERQDELASNISSQLKPGGKLICEFGGYGCGEKVHGTLEQCFQERGLKYPREFYFPTIGEYVPVLERNGLRCDYAVLFDRFTRQKTEDGLADWINMFVKRPFEGISPDVKAEIISETKQRLEDCLFVDGSWYIDYVRIRVRAVKV